MKKRIFIVDDHPLMRCGYEALIGHEPDLEVCGAAGSAQEAMEKFAGCNADLLICDIALGGKSGLDLVKLLLVLCPTLPVLFVSMHDETTYASRALAVGAHGYMMKSEVAGHLIDAIREVLSGGIWVSEDIAKRMDAGSRSEVDPLLPLHLPGLDLPLN